MVSNEGKDCSQAIGDKVDKGISSFFFRIGQFVANRPIITIVGCLLVAGGFGAGLAVLKTESRVEKLWVPQNTIAEEETTRFQEYFPEDRVSLVVVQSNSSSDRNVLTKDRLLSAMNMHNDILTREAKHEDELYTLPDVCTRIGGTCADFTLESDSCQCFIRSILKQWNYDITTLENDNDVLATISAGYRSREEIEDALGNAEFDENGNLISAEAFSVIYLLEDRSVDVDGRTEDKLNDAWEEKAFLAVVKSGEDYPGLSLAFFATRSFADEFGDAIGGDIMLVQISYLIIYFALALLIGKPCGPGSRWLVSFGGIIFVALSTLAAIGLSSYFGLFYGPVHSLLPFVLLGIGVDDSFVIANAFNRERKVSRSAETNESLKQRAATALARAGASITVTSATDMVAFAISSSSSLPALGSFCGYAAIGIFFLWFFAATFFPAIMVQDEKRQKANRCDLPVCCFKFKNESKDEAFEEGFISNYFRKYHAPAILHNVGKIVVLLLFSGLLGLGINGAINLSVEDSQRNFIPSDSYINDYFEAADEFFSSGSTTIGLSVVFEDGEEIYNKRSELEVLYERLDGLSEEAPFIRDPTTEATYSNVMTGFAEYVNETGSDTIFGVALGSDGWPTNYADFVTALKAYTSIQGGAGARYIQDMSFSDEGEFNAFRVQLQYGRLLKTRRGQVVDDADKQIEAMDATRDMVESWNDLPTAFPYSAKFIEIEGFKIIRAELFRNAALAILAVGVITAITLGNLVTSAIVTVNVVFCIVEILGFMYYAGLVIDSVSVINIVLAIGLSVDYSAHVAHNFMVKGGDDKKKRVTEALADIGSSVLSGGITTFLAVVVLLNSSSYVFEILSIQFAITVVFGLAHGLILLPVFLSFPCTPKPLSSADH